MRSISDIQWRAAFSKFRALFTKKRVLIGLAIIAVFLIITPIVTYAYYAHDISDRERLMNRNSTGYVLKDRHGKVFYEYGTVNSNDNVPLSKISDNLEHALIASEDKGFYSHPGFSVKGIIGAAYADVMHKSATAYGGSTITQQLVKNRLLSTNKNYFRKYQEISMAIAVERKYSKDEILDMYLNSVYFGEGAFGINAAAKTYFGKSPGDLSVAESSMLVGLLPAPSAYSPISGDRELAVKQQKRVLGQMVEAGYLTASDRDKALAEPLHYADASSTKQTYAQHFANMIIRDLEKKYGEEKVVRSGYQITTTLDLDWQKTAEQTVKDRVAVMKSLGGRNASLVAEDPTSGEIRALVGSVDWNNPDFGQVNMATALRQPGSSFKPIYFSKALQEKIVTPATILDDSEKTFGGKYSPRDYDNQFKGKMRLRNALAESRNVTAVEVMQKLGVDNAIEAAHEMGLSSVDGDPSQYGLSLALGTAEVRLIDMVHAYSAFANQGKQHERVMVTKIQDKYGHTVFQHKNASKAKDVRSKGSAYLIDSILSDKSARAPTYGSRLNIPGHDVAFKTGTTNDSRDAWTIGFVPNLVVGVWVGNNEHEPMTGLAGGSAAGVIWKQTMSDYLQDIPTKSFQKPSTIIRISICEGQEARAVNTGTNTYAEYFIEGSEPTKTCNAVQPKKQEKTKPEDTKTKKKDNKKKDNQAGGRGADEPTPTDGTTDPTTGGAGSGTNDGSGTTDSGSTGGGTTDGTGTGGGSGTTDGGSTGGSGTGTSDGTGTGTGGTSGTSDGGGTTTP